MAMAPAVTEDGKDQLKSSAEPVGEVKTPSRAEPVGEVKTPSRAQPVGEVKTPSRAQPVVKKDSDNTKGLILATGEINWECPCLDDMATGPCGAEFRAAFSCFHFSSAEVKGSDCMQPLRAMQACFRRFPQAYSRQDNKADAHKPPKPQTQTSSQQRPPKPQTQTSTQQHPVETPAS